MKCFTIRLLIFITFLNTSAFAQPVVGEYRSRQNGDWNDYNTWEQWDGSGWVTQYQTGTTPVSPIVEAYASGIQNTNATSHTITLPSGIVAGELLLVVFSVDGSTTVVVNSTISGDKWTKLGQANEGGDVTGAIFWKIAEEGDVLTLTTGSQQSTHISYRISGGTTFAVTGSSDTDDQDESDPPTHTPPTGSAPYLWIATTSRDGNSVHTGFPNNFSNLLTQAGGTDGASTSTAIRNFSGTSQNPGTFEGGSDQEWVSYTLAVYSTEPTYTPISYPQTGSSTSPVVAGTNSSTKTSSGGGNHNIALPSGIQAGDLILIFYSEAHGTNTDPSPSGYTLLYSDEEGSDRYRGAWYKIADGTEGSSITVGSYNGRSAHTSYRIAAGTYTGIPVASSLSIGDGQTGNPPNLISGFGAVPTMWITACHSEGTGTMTAPIDYTGVNFFDAYTGDTGDDHARMGTSHRFTIATSENPEPGFGLGGSNRRYASVTIGIKGGPNAIATILNTDTVTVTANVTVDETTIEDGGELVINELIVFTTPVDGVFINEGTLSGKGTLDLSGSTFTNEGTIAPGLSPGVLSIEDDFINNGILEIEITGPPSGMGAGPGLTFDQLEIEGTAEINGTIIIDFGMYVPMVGDEYQIILSKAPEYLGMPTIMVINNVADVTYVNGLLTIDALGPLPVTWLSFHAKAEGKEVLLTWSTVSELNNEGFDVQRSMNGRDWTTLGFVAGAGTSNREHHYSYTDKSISVIQPYYYRLAQMDYDGTIEYSPVRAVTLSGPQVSISAYPNPAIGEVTITFSEPTDGHGTVQLFNQNGSLVSEQIIAPQTVNYSTQVSHLPAGAYILVVKVGASEWTKQVIVR